MVVRRGTCSCWRPVGVSIVARKGTKQGGKTNFDFTEVEAVLVGKRDLRD